MTMSDKGEKICPLCTEEMDLTDQQLKPCQCGYEICVWCWHHIMDMAEKDETEGRCPACRTAYDKEKIVGMASNCRSAVAEIKVERKQKVQKAKPKASEVRKHLSSVRVFQRNLVHVIGMPLSIADEELLKRREYFGQYGKVLKACISRTASGVIQHSSNDCFSVYITYSKEEEAVRCIQSVHGFTLEDRCLRACFGTTKYCNSWLNNVPCSSQHCLYLHEYGSEQDTFSKEEMTSAFTRVQQTIGASHNMQMRFGNVLPPPADENNNVTLPSIDKPVDKVTLKSVDKHKVSLPDANTKKPCGPLPAVSCVNHIPIWPLVSSSSGLAGPGKQRSALSHDAKVAVLPSSVSSAKKLESDVVNNFKKNEETLEVHSDIKMNPSESTAHSVDKNGQTPSLNRKAVVISKTTPVVVMASNVSPCRSPPKQGFESIATSSTSSSLVEPTKEGSSSIQNKVENTNIDELQRLSLELSSMGVYSSSLEDENYIPDVSISIDSVGAPTAVGANGVLEKENSHVLDDHEPNGSGSFHHSMSLPFSAFNESSNHSRWDSWKFDGSYIGNNNSSDPQKVPIRTDFATLPFSSGKSKSDDKWLGKSQKSFTEMDTMLECSNLVPDFRTGNGMGRFKSDIANLNDNGASDMGESRIISNILSMDGWEDGLTSSNNFAKLFAESDRQHGSDILRNAGKLQNANQSRFLFAQEEDLPIQASKLEHSFNQMPGQSFLRQDSVKNNSPPVGNGHSSFSYTSFSGFDSISRSQCLTSSNMLSVSKPRISTPPGFSASNKAPPPGFSTHERMDLAVGNYSANHLVQTPFFSGGSTQFPTNGYSPSHLDSELNDPAILEIGKGLPITGMNQTGSSIWHNSYAPVGPSDYEARLQHLMQKPAALHQNPKLIDQFDNRFSTPNNVYSPPTFPDYLQSGNVSPFAPVTNQHVRNDKTNGYWGGVNPVNGINHPAISDFYSNESFGLTSNKLVPGYEDAMFRMSGSGNLYNRGFGI